MIGRTLGARYQIVSQLGSGGMAVVYKGMDTVLNRTVTIKILREQLSNDQDFVRRFQREAQAIASLSHPNIVNVYDVGRERDADYIVMEFVDGPTLKEVIRQRAPLPPNEAINLAVQICEALDHAHEHGIIHRDVKPHNILLTKSGRVKVTDFGIARSVDQGTVTHDRSIIGSVHYLSPEQARGSALTAATDIYSLGVVLYEMLTGRVPFEGENAITVALQQIQQEPAPPSVFNPTVSKALEEVVMRSLEKQISRRYATAKAMCRDLSGVFTGKIEGRLPAEDPGENTVIMNSPLEIPDINSQQGPEKGMPVNEEKKGIRRPKRGAKGLLTLLAGIILLSLLGIGSLYGFQRWMSVDEVKVPDVVGKSYYEADNLLYRQAELKYEIVDRVHHNEIAKDHVVSQDPPANTLVKKTRVVRITMSLGKKMNKVPEVVNLPQREAEIKLLASEFKVDVEEKADDKIPRGQVMAQSPMANSELAVDSTVKISVSKGPDVKTATMISAVGQKLTDAMAKLENIGVNLQVETITQMDTGFPTGTVVAQDPGVGSQIRAGDKVVLTVAGSPAGLPNGGIQPLPGTKSVPVTFQIVSDNKKHEVKVTVTESSGKQTDYYRATHLGGEMVSLEIKAPQKSRIEAFVDSMKVYSKVVD